MTIQESGVIMDVLKAAYPRFYAGTSAADLRNAVALWAELFADDDLRIVKLAVRNFIEADEKGFPPNVGQIKAKVRELDDGAAETRRYVQALQAWYRALPEAERTGMRRAALAARAGRPLLEAHDGA